MFGIESLLTQVFGGNALLVMLAGFFLLIIMNLVTRLTIEIKNKNLQWDDFPEFIKPIILYSAFLIGLDILVATGSGMPVIRDLFQGLQILGYVAVMGKYFKRFYCNLKELGMPVDKDLDKAFDNKLDGLGDETKKEIADIVEEYLAQKEKQKEAK